MFNLRFDLRVSDADVPRPDLYAAALEMCAWAETRGAASAVLSEHHATEDGHIASPLMFGAAIAARTKTLPIMLAAVVLPLYDPVRLAEDMSLLDVLSRGRVSYVFGIGHRREEYEHLGVDFTRRGRIADESLALLVELLKGQPVVHQGRRIQVSPPPLTPGGPRIMIAGGSVAAVKRAARYGFGFVAQASPPGLKETYEAECRAHGHAPGPAIFPTARGATTVFVAEDVDRAWRELGPYMLREAKVAAGYRHGDDSVASISLAQTVEELRASQGAYRIFTPAEAVAEMKAGKRLGVHPLCGGIPPSLAWPYLEQAAAAYAQLNGQG
jgi:alkanesulfonate monooxygenase SsuD/methylene tetrahydromethanopterin reductase-like flavin-dependent oxidoreductase (luciferase family)